MRARYQSNVAQESLKTFPCVAVLRGCKQVINKKVQTITKYFCKSPAKTKTSSSWTAEGRAPSPRGLVELEDETINETGKKEDQKDSKSTATCPKEKKSNVTRIRSSNKILQGQEQDQTQT